MKKKYKNHLIISKKDAKVDDLFKKLGLAIGICLLIASCTSYNKQNKNKENFYKDEGINNKITSSQIMDTESEYKDEGFSVQIPAGVEVERKNPLGEFGDFYLCYFSIGGEHFLTAYIGNHPSFCLDAPSNVKTQTGIINGLSFERAEFESRSGNKRVEVLLQFSSDRSWPMYIHFICEDVPSSLESIVDEIINSLEEK